MKRRAFLQSASLLGFPMILGRFGARTPSHGDQASRLDPNFLTRPWSARWIAVPGASAFDYGVYHFRRAFDLPDKPSSFVVHVTADNRYQLFVNGERVVWGPARSDLNHWCYETVDLAPRLKAGRNVLAALVWNFGEYAPEAQVTHRTAFLVQSDSARERVVDTNAQWKCVANRACKPLHYTHAQMRGYFVAGPCDSVDGASYPWGWELPDFDDAAWAVGQSDPRWGAAPRESIDAPNRWLLVPRDIPLMEERPERLAAVRRSSGVTVAAAFPQQPAPFTVPANSRANLLLDQGRLTTAYPELVVSGGAGAVVRVGYAEALFVDAAKGLEKGNRNDVEGKTFVGLLRQLHERRRQEPGISPALVAHVPLRRRRHRNQGRAAHDRGSPRRLHRLSLRAEGEIRRRVRANREDARRRLADREALRARDLHGLPVLRAAAVRRRHAHPGARLVLQRRATRASRRTRSPSWTARAPPRARR